ncbi:MAG TPA: FAD-dependent oxidoreductase [bacterium]|nr:FAD-dependent oxidoreductase [bacterium]
MSRSGRRVVVVGAGIVGAACAYYLARAGHRVTVFDTGEIGGETTAASGSAVLDQTKGSPFLLELNLRSKALFGELKRDLEIPYRVDGSYVLFRDAEEERFLLDRVAWLQAQDVHIDLLTKAEVASRIAGVADDVQGATYAPQDAEAPPRETCQAIAAGATRLGAVFHTGTSVVGFDVAADGIRAVRTPFGDTPCDEAVIAAGPWTRQLVAKLGVSVPMRPQKGELLFTDPVGPCLRGRVLSGRYLMNKVDSGTSADGFSAGLVVGQEPDGRIKIGSTREWAEFDCTPTVRARERLLDEVARYMPGVATLPINAQTVGLRPYSLLKRPIVARVRKPAGLVLACGHGGDGLAFAPVTGWLVAQIVSGIATELESHLTLTAHEESVG